MKLFFYLIFIVIVVSACKEVFDPPPQAFVGTSFMNSDTQKAISSKISVWREGTQTYWLKDTLLEKVILPLSPNDTSKLIISLDSYIDTITFFHSTVQKYASMETGFYFEYKLKSINYTHHRITDIEIADSLVTINWHENIILYLRPLPAGSN
jgi:hypothetical protein